MAFPRRCPDLRQSSEAIPREHACADGRDDAAERPTLEGVDLEDLTKRLVAYAGALLYRRRTWRGNVASGPPGAASAGDFVNDAFAKYLSGTRCRPPGLALDKFLAQVIRSDISHLTEAPENREHYVFLTDADAVGIGMFAVSALADVEYATAEERLIAEEWLRRVRAAFPFPKDEQFVRYVTLLLRREYDDSAGLAKALRVSIAAIGNFRRRLARFVARVRREGGS